MKVPKQENVQYVLSDWNTGEIVRDATDAEISEGLSYTQFHLTENEYHSDVFDVDNGREVCLHYGKETVNMVV